MDYRALFSDYATLEMDLGGPDPQVSVATSMACSRSDPIERAWFAGCYVSVYTVTGAEILVERLSSSATDAEIANMIGTRWPIPMRMERKAAGVGQSALARCLSTYRDWLVVAPRDADYDRLWSSLDPVHSFGRYTKIKLLEVLRRVGFVSAHMPDIRPSTKWPRLGLRWLRPDSEHMIPLTGGSTATINDIAEETRLMMTERLRRALDVFTFEVLLCNYRQTIKGKYPGRGHDSELGFWRRSHADRTSFFETRHELWSPFCLGEKQGWDGVRSELGSMFTEFNYLWSDLRYDYNATKGTGDFANPVRRDAL